MKLITLFVFSLCFVAHAQTNIPVVIAERWIKGETDTEQVWIDKMSDGTYRESIVKKAPTVVRSKLIATNDVGFAWRFDYEAKLSDGSVVTNAAFRPKPAKVKLNDQLAAMASVPQPPMPSTNEVDRIEVGVKSMKSPASAALAGAVVTHKRAKNNRPVTALNAGNGKMVLTYKDGSTEVKDIKHVVSARKPSPYAKDIKPPAGNKYTAKELAAFAAGVAAALAAYGIKKAV